MLQSADAFNPPPLQLQCHTAFHCSTQHAQRTLASFAMAAPPSRASHHSRVPGLRSEDAAYRVTGPDARRLLRSSASAILSPTRPRTGASHASLARPTTGRSVSSRSSFTSRKSGQTVSRVVVRCWHGLHLSVAAGTSQQWPPQYYSSLSVRDNGITPRSTAYVAIASQCHPLVLMGSVDATVVTGLTSEWYLLRVSFLVTMTVTHCHPCPRMSWYVWQFDAPGAKHPLCVRSHTTDARRHAKTHEGANRLVCRVGVCGPARGTCFIMYIRTPFEPCLPARLDVHCAHIPTTLAAAEAAWRGTITTRRDEPQAGAAGEDAAGTCHILLPKQVAGAPSIQPEASSRCERVQQGRPPTTQASCVHQPCTTAWGQGDPCGAQWRCCEGPRPTNDAYSPRHGEVATHNPPAPEAASHRRQQCTSAITIALTAEA